MPRRSHWLKSLALFLCAGTLGATTVVRLDDAELTKKSEYVLQGTIEKVESAVRPGPIQVCTVVHLRVEDVWKGDWLEPVAYLSMPGGTLDGTRVVVPGTPSFAAGEEVVVFVREISTGERILTGLTQGQFRVHRSSGATRVVRDLGDVAYVQPGVQAGHIQGVVALEDRTVSDDLEAFRARIEGYSFAEGN